MSRLLLLRQEGYDRHELDSATRKIFEAFDAPSFIRPGASVLLKVNLVAGHPPERRATTDPAVVRSVTERVLELGAHPVIADSPGIEPFRSVAEKSGLAAIARELGIPCLELTDSTPLPTTPDSAFKKVEVSRLVLESDVIINLPKMKTHGQMLLTLGVKNLFGCIVGQRKAEWHYNVGLDCNAFAGLLLELYLSIAPHLTIMDGVIGMDGTGPTSGNPYPFGLLAAAQDALALDFQLARMMGVRLEDFPLWRVAVARNLPQCELSSQVTGDFPQDHVFPGVKVPLLRGLNLLPRLPFKAFWDSLMASRPVHVPELCIDCGRCEAVCAAKALKHRNRRLTFDYTRCIRCYCCHEMCPVRAIEFRESFLMRLMRLLRGTRS
ncbi:MAG: DUF362 domain-containing protein [Fretibacterium sp.]|nr:DUF362 domain-containing protein [Fretibacterium sp.]